MEICIVYNEYKKKTLVTFCTDCMTSRDVVFKCKIFQFMCLGYIKHILTYNSFSMRLIVVLVTAKATDCRFILT